MSWVQPIFLTPHDEFVVVSAVRYAMGRATYIVEMTCTWVKNNWHLLSDNTKHVVARDVEQEVELRRGLGDNQLTIHQIDNRYWEELWEHIRKDGYP